MFKRNGKHRKPGRLHVGPLFALEAIAVTFAAKREAEASTARQASELSS